MGKKEERIRPGEGSPAPVGRVERPPSSPPPSPPPPPTDILGETGGEAPLSTLRGRKRSKGETPKQESGYAKPPPLRRFRPTSVPGFDPSRPPPVRAEYARGPPPTPQPPPTEKESTRPRLLPPDTYPRSARQVKEDEREEARRAAQTQTWTSTIHGLGEDSRPRTPQKGLCRVSPIQCALCRTYWLPVLQFCYRCFPSTALSHIIEPVPLGSRVEYRCILCFTRRTTRAGIRRHALDDHIPQAHVEYRYPFTQQQLLVIFTRDEDRYNQEVRPRSLPLKDGICILREPPGNDPDGAAGLNWYSPPIATRSDWRVPWPAPPKPEAKMSKTRSSLDCQLCGNPGCTMVCGTACIEAITAIAGSTATLFQMQQATNRGTPLPFPTVRETAFLRDAYDGSEPRGRPSAGALAALVGETRVSVKEINAWFSAERRARGHTAPGEGRFKEPPRQ